MAFCRKCGKEIADGDRFCPYCGDATGVQQGPASAAGDWNQAEMMRNDISNNKAMAVLSYIGLLVLVPILAAPKSRFARFHANQGLILLILEVIWLVASGIISAVLSIALPWLHFLAGLLGIVNVLFLILMIIGIVNAANGEMKELPVIGGFQLIK